MVIMDVVPKSLQKKQANLATIVSQNRYSLYHYPSLTSVQLTMPSLSNLSLPMEQMKHRASWSSETLSCVPVGTQMISGNRSEQESSAGLQITYPLPANLREPIHKNGYDNVQSQSGDNHKERNVHNYSQAKGRK